MTLCALKVLDMDMCYACQVSLHAWLEPQYSLQYCTVLYMGLNAAGLTMTMLISAENARC